MRHLRMSWPCWVVRHPRNGRSGPPISSPDLTGAPIFEYSAGFRSSVLADDLPAPRTPSYGGVLGLFYHLNSTILSTPASHTIN